MDAHARFRAWVEGVGGQTSAAGRLGIHQSTISHLVRRLRRPTLAQAAALERLIGIPMAAWPDSPLASEVLSATGTGGATP